MKKCDERLVNFRWVKYQRRRMRQILSLHESRDRFAAAGRTGSSEEWRRRCLEGESSQPRRSSAWPRRRAARGCGADDPLAFELWLAAHAEVRCNKGVRSARLVFGKVLLPRGGGLTH